MLQDAPPTHVRQRFLRNDGTQTASASERLILDLVRRAGAMSRADLTRACGFSVPGAKALIDSLVERRLLKLGPAATRGRGQPSATVSLVPEFAYCLGLSIMVDGYSLALMDFSGRVMLERFEPSFPLELEQVATKARIQVGDMVRAAGIDPGALFGIGLSMTGPFVGRGSRVNPPLSMPAEWATAELDRFFAERLGHPVWMDNDANCAATAESLFGVGRTARNFVYLHFTDGFGGGVVLDGKIMRGAHGNAGELGRIFALTGMARPTLETLHRSLVAAGHDLPDLNSMIARYDPAWPQIDHWLDSVRSSVSVTVAAIVALLDPEVIVWGARLPRDLAQRLIACVEFEQAPRRGTPAPNPVLMVAQTPANAAVVGAATLPFKEHFFL